MNPKYEISFDMRECDICEKNYDQTCLVVYDRWDGMSHIICERCINHARQQYEISLQIPEIEELEQRIV